MNKVFISYSFHDLEVRRSVDFLRERLPYLGAEPVIIEDILEAGSNWQMDITEQINKCSIFITFVDRNNSNVMFELGYALAKNKKIIVIGDLERMPADLRSMIYIPRYTHPHEILMHVEKYLYADSMGINPHFQIDIGAPENAIRQLIDRPDLLDALSANEFEELIANWFNNKNHQVERSTDYRDYGYDFSIFPFRGEMAAVEVKKYKSTSLVSLSIVRQLLGAMVPNRLRYGIIVSSAPFTKSASFFINDIEQTILLLTLSDLAQIDMNPQQRVDNYIPNQLNGF